MNRTLRRITLGQIVFPVPPSRPVFPTRPSAAPVAPEPRRPMAPIQFPTVRPVLTEKQRAEQYLRFLDPTRPMTPLEEPLYRAQDFEEGMPPAPTPILRDVIPGWIPFPNYRDGAWWLEWEFVG